MKLHYKAITQEGKRISGEIDAKNIEEAGVFLRSRNLLPINLSKKKESTLLDMLPFFKKTKASDISLFTRQLSSMLTAGITLLRSLQILEEQTQNTAMKEVIKGMIADIEDGKSFSTAIAKYPETFPLIYSSLVRAAESAGLLDKVLERLAENLEKQQKLKSTIKSALLYPLIVIILMGVVMFIMMIFVIPQLSDLYKSLNIDLPLPTKIVVAISTFTKNFWFLIIAGALILSYAFRKWRRSNTGELIVDNIELKIPVFGKIINEVSLTEFSRTFGLLVGSGTLIIDALSKTSDTLENIHFRRAVKDIANRMEKGIPLGDSMATYSLFPPLLLQLVKIGEETGKLDETLLRASVYYEDEVDRRVKGLTTVLEPFIMIVLGIAVAFLILAVLTPIYKLTSSIQ
ncbi:MAG TPA: type II secretion system F family protein [Candidatus Saccharimonadales bacterium]|nr:type II secretion system F family protein [Candidatus Saccharimonadales bacterium]